MPTLDPKRNDAVVQFGAGFATGATTASLISGDGAKLPDTAEGAFNLTVWDNTLYPNAPYLDPNRERIRVTVRTGDVLTTIQRAQEGTSNVNHNTSGHIYKAVLSYTKKDRDDLETFLGGVALKASANIFTNDQTITRDTDSQLYLTSYVSTANQFAYLFLRKARGSSASPSNVLNGDEIFRLYANAYNAGNFRNAARIGVIVDGAPGATYVPGRLEFLTSDGTSDEQVRMTLKGIGNLGLGTSPVISDGIGLHLSGKILRLGTAKTPASSTDTINTGEIFWDANYLYVGVGTNSIKRIALTTF